MTVRVHLDVEAPEVSPEEVRDAVRAALQHGGKANLEVDVILVSEAYLTDLHLRFLGDDSSTDVLAFALGSGDEGPDAEIYVSVDRAREVAAARGVTVARETALYAVHGALHLCGFDDHDAVDRARMREAESEVLTGLGHSPDLAPHDQDEPDADR